MVMLIALTLVVAVCGMALLAVCCGARLPAGWLPVTPRWQAPLAALLLLGGAALLLLRWPTGNPLDGVRALGSLAALAVFALPYLVIFALLAGCPLLIFGFSIYWLVNRARTGRRLH